MFPKEVEVILARQLASYLAMPIFIVDPEGALVFYNEPAELLLGCRFEETGELAQEQWSRVFTPLDDQGEPIAPDGLPLVVATQQRCPAHKTFWIRGFDQVLRHIHVTAFPLVGQADRFVGAVAIFWEVGA